ncbi:MAG: fasciclin domain-containing protein [Candidatus Velthaea sp.]
MRLFRAAAWRLIAAALAGIALTGTAFAATPASVFDVASAQKDLTTFVSAVKTAGLTGMLSGPGDFTVFAPTDAAFAKMPAADRDALMRDPAKLKALILDRVVSERITINTPDGNLRDGSFASVGGAMILAHTDKNDRLMIGDAHVVKTDMSAKNGVLTTIDGV